MMKITKTDWSNPDEKVMHISVKGMHLRNHKLVKTTKRYWVTRTVETAGNIFYYGTRVKWNTNPSHGTTGQWMGWGKEKCITSENMFGRFESYSREWI